MEQRIFHGAIKPQDIARALAARFNQGNLRTQQFGQGDKVVVQIATSQAARSGGSTALTITLQQVEDGVGVQVGKQAWLGLAASLGQSALAALRNPLNLLGRLDDIAQDIENIQLSEEVWKVIEDYARMVGATFELSERLRRLVCSYCRTANPVGEPACIACGAPLGDVQPKTCPHCGFVVRGSESVCPNCHKKLFITT